MYRVRHYVGPERPPTLEAYDYLGRLRRRDLAWEGLRRLPAYQDDVQAHLADTQVSTRLESGALLTRMHEPSPRAAAWALRSFRRSVSDGTRGEAYLDTAGRAQDSLRRRRSSSPAG